ncbi:MAG: rRNA maturation RNase YbeY [Candidatus Eisenbacteria bacterium]|uniref:Endoribonuclease YbeY n=1 Tax=Eiseniibacteriota bacterium TaxID=2212470 RepID=A0A9D6QI15_UNCEI|nr:rRNA maturation RNase YbeY [Candidatus Eisenbacteria bacterium]
MARLVPPLRALVRAALDAADRRAGAIGLTLTGDDEIRALNRRWRRLDRATDVLSFGYDEAAGATPVDGDLVVSMERVMVQARRYRVTPGRELARLVIHGALHLAGLDHATATERRAMRRSEARVLAAGRAAIAALDRALAARRRGAGRPH